ncbi:A/G-specific adenine glycosylase [Helicobacter cinaedi]|uniref:Adenine DNA glycosylase n=1 Tax=Helicobacter cinaedi CCUG 18818 = ATCC BAA-847 TaxID=537971 RepID=A0AAI8MPP5_9HELI|nr:A/G-specific adenine glycosylase [Helicobacter cinaedi]AWK62546.1 A/G-specific adenine glycosylase [Helicobacter cinaedi]EFR46108.1 A/G-specific adenine glycosylase [Helicobacter cinaedi CCUG 18818 = ATCC BAA-847]QOQ90650.1 A/G-specific adenine glycosylase [Helicobacter cinaedi]QOQ96817.1 A/G-specific adenine glycosylase [Helicobacter cinaedi]BAM33468.1 A/G-specific adenine glycosylase [Helicobacter cinaedi CCUG 18818 = ATCC BAA-847]
MNTNPAHKAKGIAKQYQIQLLEWYAIQGRTSLPWRTLKGENAPYGVYVSEIMLQQTQVKRVQEHYFTPFLNAFPTLESLAKASLDSILKQWEGLGYYTRARNMQKAAILCCEKYNATLPNTRKDLLKLPGIGAYTSGAILCFGFHQSVSFVDGNIRRVLCRIFALREPNQKLLDGLAFLLLDTKHSFDYNQALLDLGAMICTPKSPNCLICPMQNLCNGKVNPTLYPTPKTSSSTPLTLHLLLYKDSKGRIAFVYEKGDKGGLYQGLYNLPQLKLEALANKQRFYKCGSFKHHYTKYAITANVYKLDSKHLNLLTQSLPHTKLYFFSQKELESRPLSSLCKKALEFV